MLHIEHGDTHESTHRDEYVATSLSDRQSPTMAFMLTCNKPIQYNVRTVHAKRCEVQCEYKMIVSVVCCSVAVTSKAWPASFQGLRVRYIHRSLTAMKFQLCGANRWYQFLLHISRTTSLSCRLSTTVHNVGTYSRSSDRHFCTLRPTHTPKPRNIPCGRQTIRSGDLRPIGMVARPDRPNPDDQIESLR